MYLYKKQRLLQDHKQATCRVVESSPKEDIYKTTSAPKANGPKQKQGQKNREVAMRVCFLAISQVTVNKFHHMTV